MGMWARVRDWRGRSRIAKVDSYTRWMLYLLPCAFPVLKAVELVVDPGRPHAMALTGVGVLQALLGIEVLRRSMNHYLWRKPAPWWGVAGQTVLLAGVVVAFVVAVRADGEEHATENTLMLMHGWLSVFGPLSLTMRLRRYLALCLGMALLLGGALVPLRVGWGPVALVSSMVFLIGLWSASVARVSGWMLRVMWELEEARDAQARLAVAEERLRFGRDLHDVLGRNLAVIALKSELAVQLARRGSSTAVDQMTEIQRIARDSQREVREVVRGYREADLHTELAGARGVLSAAGIDCRIDGAAGGELPVPVQSALAWVVREATTNVLRHADARRCAVRMRVTEGVAVLVMENDGVPEAAASGGGSGLGGLRERLAALEGTLTAERRPPAVFRLTARVPVAGGGMPDTGGGDPVGGGDDRVGAPASAGAAATTGTAASPGAAAPAGAAASADSPAPAGAAASADAAAAAGVVAGAVVTAGGAGIGGTGGGAA
ncbi:sensor histidine kinase [Streptomyces sp. ISL-11]|uniref:sensor histidine kinase n=1 Tax=Streptomyces sp. ISL-11 TaxID=2819174 RepID=UPI001BE7CD2A|nr:histidine kinase [Streptomyces sp. ISL-11]MBT2385408.1 sensor histidine kinase [Streptomyces sp. ISL-11]